jgi:HAD superfamily hydrolase (TIGR01509 family)
MKNEFAIIFDMDGVLIDSNPFHKIALRQFCKRYGHDLSDEQLKEKIYGRTNKEWITNIFGELTPEQLNAYTEEKESLFRELYDKDIRPLNGLIPFLKLLEHHQIPRAIATSAPRTNVDFTFEKTEIGRYFEIVLHDTHVSKGKPNPEIYLKTARAIGMPPSKCVVFEDSISGIQAGKASGARVVGVTTTHRAEELEDVDLVIDDFVNLSPERVASLVI